MRIKNPLIVAALSLLGVITFIVVYPLTLRKSPYKSVKIEGRDYQLKTATNAAEWSRGLMFVKGKQDYDGMIFYFPDKSKRTFWNMNTLVDLDLLWMDGDRVIGKSPLPSVSKTKTVMTVSSPGPADRVVELFRK
ncbi:DUF192 domain-containing protein [Candidatus Microgenomates bacterium]|nr:DUF192 domain-containing protein [Candidatus Microgenomates bacterium]